MPETFGFKSSMIWLTINRIFNGNLFRLAYEEMLLKTDLNFGGITRLTVLPNNSEPLVSLLFVRYDFMFGAQTNGIKIV